MQAVRIWTLRSERESVKTLIVIVAWCLLGIVCWPLAVAALILLPLIWVLALPLRLLSIVLDAVFSLIKAILFLPARLLGSH
jgi:hypothetical protein